MVAKFTKSSLVLTRSIFVLKVLLFGFGSAGLIHAQERSDQVGARPGLRGSATYRAVVQQIAVTTWFQQHLFEVRRMFREDLLGYDLELYQGPEAGSFDLDVRSRQPLLFRTTVRLTQVTLENLREKLAEAAALVDLDYRRYRALFVRRTGLNQQPVMFGAALPHSQSPAGLPWSLGTSVGMGSHPYISVWVQMPALRTSSVTGDRSVETFWMRTLLQLDGALGFPSAGPTPMGAGPVMMARTAVDIFGISLNGTVPRDRGINALVRVGTVRAHLSHAPHAGQTSTRVDLDFVGLGYNDSFRLSDAVSLLMASSLRLGLRVLEQSRGTLSFIFGGDFRLGVLFAERVFIEGGVASEIGTHQPRDFLNIFGSCGYVINDQITIRAGVNYSLPASQLGGGRRDDLSVIPEGVSGLTGIFVRF